MKERPFGVTLLAIFAALAFVVAVYHTLQMLHLLPFRIDTAAGVHRFFSFDLFGALLWGLMAVIYLWVFRMLWAVNPQGWLFVVVLATLNLILAGVSIIGQTTWTEMLPSILINGIILIYCTRPGVRAAFGA